MSNATPTGPAGTGRIVGIGGDWMKIERDGERRTHRLHRGCRLGHLGADPRDPGLMVLAVESGPGPGPAEETFVTVISPDGLEALARDLLAAVERHRTGRAIDMRFLV